MSDQVKMSLRKWMIGVAAALGLSLFVALAGLASGGNWKTFLAVFGAAAVTHYGAWMKEHPVDQIEDEEHQTKIEK